MSIAIVLLIFQVISVVHSDTAMHNSTVIELNSTTVPAIDQENQFTSEFNTTEPSKLLEKSNFTNDNKLENASLQLKFEDEIKKEPARDKNQNLMIITTSKPLRANNLEKNTSHQNPISSIVTSLISSYLHTILSLISTSNQIQNNGSKYRELEDKNSANRIKSFSSSSEINLTSYAENISEISLSQRIDMTEIPPNTTIDFFGSNESLNDDIIGADYDFDDLDDDNENITENFGIFKINLNLTTISPVNSTIAEERSMKNLSEQRSNHQAVSEQNMENLFSQVNLNNNSLNENSNISQKLSFSSKYSGKVSTTRIPKTQNQKEHINHTETPKILKKREIPLASDYDLAERPDLLSYFRNAEIIRQNYLSSGKKLIDQDETPKNEDIQGDNWRDIYPVSTENHENPILPPENTKIQPQISPTALDNSPALYFVDDIDYSMLQDTHRLPTTMDRYNKNIQQQVYPNKDAEAEIQRQNKNLVRTIGQSVETKRKKKSNVEPAEVKNNKTAENRRSRARGSSGGHKTSSKNHRKNTSHPRKGKQRTSRTHSHTRTKSQERCNNKQSKKSSHQHKHH